MALVPRQARIEEMKRLGLSQSLVRLAQGEHLHNCFKGFTFAIESLYHYGPEPDEEMRQLLEEFPDEREEEPAVPPGPPFLPLWDQWECTTIGVWEREGQIEFLEYFWDDDCRVIAHTEQGLWCYAFLTIADRSGKNLDWSFLADAAERVGFAYIQVVQDALTKDKKNYQQPSGFYEDFRDAVSAEVDRLGKK